MEPVIIGIAVYVLLFAVVVAIAIAWRSAAGREQDLHQRLTSTADYASLMKKQRDEAEARFREASGHWRRSARALDNERKAHSLTRIERDDALMESCLWYRRTQRGMLELRREEGAHDLTRFQLGIWREAAEESCLWYGRVQATMAEYRIARNQEMAWKDRAEMEHAIAKQMTALAKDSAATIKQIRAELADWERNGLKQDPETGRLQPRKRPNRGTGRRA